jgi:hypothetical protein
LNRHDVKIEIFETANMERGKRIGILETGIAVLKKDVETIKEVTAVKEENHKDGRTDKKYLFDKIWMIVAPIVTAVVAFIIARWK